MEENRGGVLTGLSLLLLQLLLLPHSVKIKKKSTILVFKIFGIKARLSAYCQSDGSYSLLLVFKEMSRLYHRHDSRLLGEHKAVRKGRSKWTLAQ